jgi:hypothetical protein
VSLVEQGLEMAVDRSVLAERRRGDLRVEAVAAKRSGAPEEEHAGDAGWRCHGRLARAPETLFIDV